MHHHERHVHEEHQRNRDCREQHHEDRKAEQQQRDRHDEQEQRSWLGLGAAAGVRRPAQDRDERARWR